MLPILASGVYWLLFMLADNFLLRSAIAEPPSISQPASSLIAPDIAHFTTLLNQSGSPELDSARAREALQAIDEAWHPGCVVMLVEALRFCRSAETAEGIRELLQRRTGQTLDWQLDRWYDWIWHQPDQPHPSYARFKADLYSRIDERFVEYFPADVPAAIRLDEIRWGGVQRDGIPPLKAPTLLPASEANYLNDSDIVFGVVYHGDARAYPKRILAWHEMVKESIGGVSFCGVYCTLCGSMIMYRTEVDGQHHELGTSGFLYRSNKLMYDQQTKSLWSTLKGEPVVGSLTGKGIALQREYVVTSTWGAWRRLHPETLVLSLDTGHVRDYGEGVAYRNYFATDKLMFGVPDLDQRLENKAEVLALWFDRSQDQQLAITAAYLAQHPVYHDELAGVQFVVLTDGSGASRVYQTHGHEFRAWDGARQAVDNSGENWQVAEDKLSSADGVELRRLPAHRAFWFGWYSAFPNTRLVK